MAEKTLKSRVRAAIRVCLRTVSVGNATREIIDLEFDLADAALNALGISEKQQNTEGATATVKTPDTGKSNQYDFRLCLFSKENQTIEKFIGTNDVPGIVDEILKADRASKYEIVELYVKKLTPKARRLR